MLIKKPADIRYSEITPKHIYMNRRNFLAGVPAAFLGRGIALALGARAGGDQAAQRAEEQVHAWTKSRTPIRTSPLTTTTTSSARIRASRRSTPRTSRPRPGRSAWKARAPSRASSPSKRSWQLAPLEERIYRHRCVEAWSIVVPWVGYSLSALLKKVEPTAKAKYVAFETFYDRRQMPHAAGLQFPYVEGLAPGRSHAPAGAAVHGHVRRGAAAAGRRSGAHDPALEVRIQEHQIDRQNPSGGQPCRPPRGIWPTRRSMGSTRT